MSSIDTRVVEMKFNNADFQAKIARTTASLDRLEKSLQLQGATQGLNNLNAAANRTNFSHISNAVDSIANKMRTLSQVGIGVLTNLASQAASAGLRMVHSLTLEPIFDGYREYETKLNSIQTILANTAAAGTDLQDVTSTLNELNHYADKTIYNFGEMAKNIGTFTAAGVDLKTATASIKGIANLAALSGSNSEQAATAMYQLSQAISAGTVTLEDWNSVVNAGMGGTVFQRALAQTAVSMGKLEESAVKLKGPMKNVSINGEAFRKSISAANGESWLTGDVLTRTLQHFTGDLSDAQLAAEGFSKAQIKAIQKQAQMALHAATEVKTLSGLFGTLKESVGSGWAQTWEIIIGDFTEAKKLWTGVNDVLGGIVNRSADARNKMLSDWKALGGRKVLLEGLANAFHALGSVLKPIGQALRQVFPATTAKQLYEMTVSFRNFTEKLKIGSDTADKLRRTFAGVFSIFGIGWDIIKEVAKTLFELFGVVGDGSGSFLDITASIGDFLVGLRKAIQKGHVLEIFFGTLGKILTVPIKIIQYLGSLLAGLFSKLNPKDAGKSASAAVAKLNPLAKLGRLIERVWDKVISLFDDVWKAFEPLADKFSEFFSTFSEELSSAFDNLDFGDVLDAINTGLFAGLLLLLKNFFDKLKGGGGGFDLGEFIDNITGPFTQLTGTLQAMQNTLRATTLLEIAAAIAVLAVSVSILSKIDADGLTRALTAMSVMFTQLFGALAIFEKISGFKGFLKMPFVAASLILLAVAIDILSIAVKQMSDLDWEELAKGLTGTIGLLGGLVAAVRLMPKGPSLISTGLGLIAMSAGVKILASAMEDFSDLSWGEIARGLVAMAGSLAIVGAALTLIPSTAVLSAAGILIVAISLGMVADALNKMGQMSWGEIAKGLVAMLGSLAIIAAALWIIPPTAPLAAAGILVTALSMGMIADALVKLGDMSWGEIAKGLAAMLGALGIITAALFIIPPSAVLGAAGILVAAMALEIVAKVLAKLAEMSWGEIARALVALAGSLLIIGVAVMSMQTALPGAAALLVVAAALSILTPILKTLGEMSWGEIVKGLTALAGVFLVLAAAGILLTPIVPTLLLLGTAITLLGIGVLAAGAGVLLFSTALTALAAAGGAATLALVGMVSALAGLIPLVMKKIGEGIAAFAQTIIKAQGTITNAIVTVLTSLINAIVRLAPKIVNALYKLLHKMIDTMRKHVPDMVDSGLKLLNGILRGIANNIGDIVDTATDVIVAFLRGISRNLPRITDAGADLIIRFVNSLARTIRNKSGAMRSAGRNLATAIIDGMTGGLFSGAGRVASAARSAASRALSSAKSLLGINSPSKEFFKIGAWSSEGMANGLDRYSVLVSKSAEDVGRKALYSLGASMSDLSSLVDREMESNPTITPVLDLSSIRKDSSQIGSLLSTTPISVATTTSRAKTVYDGYQKNQTVTTADDLTVDTGSTWNFTQNNYSPKALSSAEIYRQTKNQISTAKGALD